MAAIVEACRCLYRRMIRLRAAASFAAAPRLICSGDCGGGRVKFCGGACCGGLFGCVLQLFVAASRLICGGNYGSGRVEW